MKKYYQNRRAAATDSTATCASRAYILLPTRLLYVLGLETAISELPTKHISAKLDGRTLAIDGRPDVQGKHLQPLGSEVVDAERKRPAIHHSLYSLFVFLPLSCCNEKCAASHDAAHYTEKR